jgi:uncharacterized protein (DUF2132 family)
MPSDPEQPHQSEPPPVPTAGTPEPPASDLSHTSRQPKNPLHGVTLEVMLRALVTQYGWPGLAEQIAVRCFATDPSMGSSLKFLRRTPWAREKVESLFLYMRRQQARGRAGS